MKQSSQIKQTTVQLFKKYTFSPFQNRNQTQNEDQLQHIAQQIYNWARNHGTQIVSFLAHPSRSDILQKHNTFLSLKFIKDNLIQSIGSQKLSFQNIWKEEIYGSSISNGGLRETSSGRTYLIWDHLSQLFIRKKYGILYIPSFIITPQGDPLDDRIHFRKAQKKLQQAIKNLLKKFKIQHNGVFLGVSIQQEFFILPKKFTDKRLDFKQTKRALVGKNPLHSPVSRNYTKKLPEQVLKALREAEDELLQLGVPVKTHHTEGGINQFQLCSQVQGMRSVADHNLIKMMILQEACQRNNLTAIFHQKPFSGINGSGKHINFSISYLDEKQKVKNLLDLKSQHEQLVVLMILMTIKAFQTNAKLLVASTISAGNEIRMGEKQAPLPIVSVSLGEQAANLVQGIPKPETKNLKQKLFPLLKKQHPDAGDRNRTSSVAFSQNRFQFRLPGSSQNPTFPLTVIMTVLMNQINCVLKQIQSGLSVSKVIEEYRESSRRVRFQGDNYSQEWKKQAQRRGIYNPQKSTPDYLRDVKIHSKVLVDNEIYSQRQIQAKYKRMKSEYFDTVKIEKDCILKMVNKNIIPRCYSFISTFPRELHLKSMENRMKKFDKLVQDLICRTEELENKKIEDNERKSAYCVRKQINDLGDLVEKVLEYLPECESFPQLYNNLNKWETV